jgi:hypothetical protein
MIALLALPDSKYSYKRHEVDWGLNTVPLSGTGPGRKSTCVINGCAAAYLRVAHIYMLISMPTDTSTIFGAFQAIFALPCYRTNFVLAG